MLYTFAHALGFFLVRLHFVTYQRFTQGSISSRFYISSSPQESSNFLVCWRLVVSKEFGSLFSYNPVYLPYFTSSQELLPRSLHFVPFNQTFPSGLNLVNFIQSFASSFRLHPRIFTPSLLRYVLYKRLSVWFQFGTLTSLLSHFALVLGIASSSVCFMCLLLEFFRSQLIQLLVPLSLHILLASQESYLVCVRYVFSKGVSVRL